MKSGRAVRILILAVVYLVFAEAGRQLALPPGYASPVWPAAGVALAGLLLCGVRCWPGVWCGSLLFNLWMEWITGVGISLPVAGLIATGASLQAVAGAALGRRFLDMPAPLAHRGDAFLYLWYTGPVACLVSATLAVGTLVLLGRVTAEQIFPQWLAWWAGDTIGVLLFAPLVFALLPQVRNAGRLEYRQLLLATVLAAILVVGAVVWLDHAEAAAWRSGLSVSAEWLHAGSVLGTFYVMLVVLASEGYSAAIAMQIGERQRVEQALRDSELFLEETGRLAAVGGWQVCVKTGEVTWTDELRRLCEWPQDVPVVLSATRAMVSPETLQRLQPVIAEAFRHGKPFDIDLPFTSAQGRPMWARVVGRVQMEDGRAVRLHGASQDITERVQMEKRVNHAQRLQAIGTMAGGIAHDLNNALAPIVLLIDLLREEYPDKGEYLELIDSSAVHASDMVKQLLAFAKGAEGQRTLLQPTYLLHEVAGLVKSTFPKNIELQSNWQQALPAILGDATQLHQVLLNLCVNSRDAMPAGGKLVLQAESCNVTTAPPGAVLDVVAGEYVVLRVSDTGSGMAQELVERIFDPFFTTKGPDKGAGLGLASVLGIVRSHKGFLQVQSQPGQGTTFAVYLPVAGQVVADSEPVRSLFRGAGEQVLFVDDEPAVRDLASAVLRHLALQPLVAASGDEALALVREHGSALGVIITDMQMPEMDGLELVRRLRGLLPHIPVIVASGLLEDPVVQALAGLGVVQRMDKPFTLDTLSEALRQALRSGEQPA